MPSNVDKQLLAIIEEWKLLSAAARLSGEARAIDGLTARFCALMDSLATKDRDAVGIGLQIKSRVGPVLGEGSTALAERGDMGMPSPQALRVSLEIMRGAYFRSETIDHPIIQSASVRLAFQLMAYGLVPAATTRESTVARSGTAMVGDGAHAPSVLSPLIHSVLIVDDMSDVLVTVGAFLSSAGFAVERATSGDEALGHIAAGQSIDVLVTDFAMPGLNGSDLILQAMRIRPGLKALLITGYPNADGLSCLPSSVEILVKPFRRDRLIAAVKSLLSGMDHPPARRPKMLID